jgi:hypothetical protein
MIELVMFSARANEGAVVKTTSLRRRIAKLEANERPIPEIWIDWGDGIVHDGDRSMTREALEAAALPNAQIITLEIV